MKSTGIVRKIDDLGRIVIPREIRTTLNISEKDPIDIYMDGSNIILKKIEQSCDFCGSSKGLKELNGKYICKDCLSKINKK